MAKRTIVRERENTAITRSRIKKFFLNKFYNLWFNSYKWSGLNYYQIDYVMSKMWERGKICAFKLKHSDLLDDEGLAFAGFSPREYNIYMNNPIKVNITPEKWTPFLPTQVLTVDKDCVIGYVQRNRLPIVESLGCIIDDLVDAEMLIHIHAQTLKMPYIIACNEEDKDRLKSLIESLLNDEIAIYGDFSDINSIKTLVNSNPYILDKLYEYRQSRENEILTYLGINNVANEKKEHLIVDEVNANNQVIEESGDCCLDSMQEFCERIRDILGYDVFVESNRKTQEIANNDNKEDDNNEE